VASRVDGVEITVADDGIGISAEGLSKVFDRFYTTAPPGSPNSGLGLAIVRSIAEADGGSVSIESPHRRGTTVSVFFPAIRG
jgi:signal transduction histidine kinase